MTTVFHSGEVLLQEESGVDERAGKMGNKIIRNYIIDQHQTFFEGLQYLFVALYDNEGRPWLTLMQGPSGFINVPDNKTLNINGDIVAQKQLSLQGSESNSIGVVGLDFSTRRRNRLNGNIKSSELQGLLSIAVDHSFGNCPKYIQLRGFEAKENNIQADNSYEHFSEFNGDDIKLIQNADTFLIASAEKKGGNLDASHRGGEPGFVRVDGERLWFNDYPGNNFFQTFGNIHNYPFVGLMFIDFNSGDLLLVSGRAKVENIEPADEYDFLPRRIHFVLDKGIRIKSAFNGAWSDAEMSPFLGDDLN